MGKTMKRVRLEEKPKTVLGKSFRIVDLEQEPASRSYTCGKCGFENVLEEPKFIEDAGLIDLLKMLVLSIPRDACTMQDSINAFDFMQQAGESTEEHLIVTDGIHGWLKKTAEKHGMRTFGVNVNAIVRALDEFERAKDKRGK